jgi:hypothetical protein
MAVPPILRAEVRQDFAAPQGSKPLNHLPTAKNPNVFPEPRTVSARIMTEALSSTEVLPGLYSVVTDLDHAGSIGPAAREPRSVRPDSCLVSCKKSIPKADIKSRTKLITDVILMGIGERFPAAPECPAGYIQAGLMMDCVYGIGVTPAGTPGGSCSGQTRICKKFEAVP